MTRKRRNLTEDEKTLWDHIAKRIIPLKSEKKRITQAPSKAVVPPSPSRQKKASFALPPQEASQNKKPLSPSTHRIRRVRRVEIEARLDLHGFTREQARKRLGQFLTRCQGCGYLWVLVITGKGRRHPESEKSYNTSPRAILRDLVPQWLEEADFRPIVSAYTIAKPQDGGSGALYIRLKRLH